MQLSSEFERQIGTMRTQLQLKEQQAMAAAQASDSSALPLAEVDTSKIVVDFMAESGQGIVGNQFEFLAAAKRSLGMHLCQSSSFIGVSCNVSQNIAQYFSGQLNQGSQILARVSPLNQTGQSTLMSNGSMDLQQQNLVGVLTYKNMIQCIIYCKPRQQTLPQHKQ